jgi:hypothetical protein
MPRVAAERPERIARLTSTPREMEAGLIVAALAEHGIKATMTGEATAGFRAEAPGRVQVLVAEGDLPRAQGVLDDLQHEGEEIDWARVDVGEPEEETTFEATPWWAGLSFWRRIASVLVVAYLLWVFANVVAGLARLSLRATGMWP